jgi:predicted transcriptional regulator
MLTQDKPPSNQERGRKVRLTVDVSPELNETLDQLADNAHLTKSEILRRAIALMKVAAQAHEKGQKLALIDKDQQALTEIVGI